MRERERERERELFLADALKGGMGTKVPSRYKRRGKR